MTHPKTDEMAIDKSEADDPQRRNLAIALLSALGGAATLQACASREGDDPIQLGEVGQELASNASAKVADNVTNLRGMTGGSTVVAVMQGYNNAGDGGGGAFYWSTAAKADDGWSTLNSGAGNSAGWRRVNPGFAEVDNVTALRALNGATKGITVLTAYSTANDGGGGTFYWSTTSAVDDGGTVFNAGGLGSNAAGWRRIYAGALNVKWFGAQCNGTNDYGALNAAINALYTNGSSGGTVLIPGVLSLGANNWAGVTVSNRNNLTLLGTDRSAGFKILFTPLQSIPIGGQLHQVAFLFSNCDSLQIVGLTFDGNLKNAGLIGFATVTHSNVVDCYLHGTGPIVTTGHFPIGITSYNGLGNTYARNRLHDCLFGLYLGLCDIGLQETDALITGNVVTSTLPSNSVDAVTVAAFNSVISENVIDGNQGGLIINSNSLTADPQLGPHGLTIEGNIIRNNNGAGLQVDRNGPNLVHDWVIRGNVFENNGRPGLFMSGTANLSVVGNTFRNNNLSMMDNGHVYLDSGHNLIIDGNLFVDDQVSHTSRVAVYLTPGALNDMKDVIISNNVVDGTGGPTGEGIRLYGVTNATVTGNVLKNNSVAGIRVGLTEAPSTNVTVANNIFHDNGADVLEDGPVVVLVSTVATNRIAFAASQPSAGTWKQGDIAWNTAAAGSGKVGWVCIGGGSPGTWKPFGAIDA